jgi:hypothetical protein
MPLRGVGLKRVFLFAALILLTTCSGFAQSGQIGIYSDADGSSGALDNTTGYMQAYCVHINSSGATACQFAIELTGTPLTLLGESSPFNSIGSSLTGVAVAYGECRTSPIHVLTINFSGTSSACDRIKIAPAPNASQPGIYVTDCTTPVPSLLTAKGGWAVINPDNTCPDNLINDSSWGRIKSIYQ